MALTGWLIDASALFRLGDSPDAAAWLDRLRRGLMYWSTVTRLESGYAGRTARDVRDLPKEMPQSQLIPLLMSPAAEERSIEVQAALADRGQHRAPSVADLLVAAVAEAARLTVLHVDKDFELIAAVTGQPTERLRLPDGPPDLEESA